MTNKLGGFNGTFGKDQLTHTLNQVNRTNYESNSSKTRGVQRVTANSA